jgi:outer membrane protein insertion porin family
VTAISAFSSKRRLCAVLLVGTVLSGSASAAFAQQPAAQQAPATAAAPAAADPAAAAPAPAVDQNQVIRSISVTGNQRLEPETVISYMPLRSGEPYNRERLDQALRDLYATELFADVQIRGGDTGNIVVEVRENPVINRIVLEGNKRIKDEKITPEIRLAPRQIFTRSKVRADVARIVELYRRQGRFAATVEPKIVQLEQNRVDLVFEINEGAKSKVRGINVLGNEVFSDGELRGQMATKVNSILSFFSSADTYDPDRLAFDQQKLRQFYLINGYADFRVVSAVAELTPDKRDFIITYVVEEGERYKVGEVKVESAVRDLKPETLQPLVPIKTGEWYDAKKMEDTVTLLTETAGLFGYAFADVRPDIDRDKESKTMSVTFQVAETPRVYVERVDINGNTVTRDKVVRREFRLAEGDPFNSIQVKRSRDRIQSLGFFQDNLEITQTQGSAADRVVLAVDLEEKSTGELQLSAGFSSLERFLVNLSIRQRNFMGKGQELRAAVNYSSYSKSVELGFTEPYVFDRNIAVGGDIFRRDFRSFSFRGDERDTTYEQTSTGAQIRAGVPLTEYLSAAFRYGISLDNITLDKDSFFSDPDAGGPLPRSCDPLLAGRFLCEQIGDRITSSIGYSLVYDTLNSRIRPTRGERIVLNQDFAGLGGDVKYLRTRLSGQKHWGLFGDSGFILSATAEGGYIHSFEESPGPGRDPVRLTDRFFLGDPQIRGFDIRGIGPRVIRRPIDPVTGKILKDKNRTLDDPIGGRAYYMARLELQVPVPNSVRELGLKPSIFIDAGALFGIKDPLPTLTFPDADGNGIPEALRETFRDAAGNPLYTIPATVPTLGGTVTNCPVGTGTLGSCTGTNVNTLFEDVTEPFDERVFGDTPKPRISVGFGVNWNSPFGPFRIDVAKALTKAEGDDTKLITFNVGTAF